MDAQHVAALDRRALVVTSDVVANLTTTDLGRPTPCEAWDVEQVLRHLISLHTGFASAARGGTDPAAWESPTQPVGELVAAYSAAAVAVADAFAEATLSGGSILVPGADPHQPLPGAVAMGIHLHETVAHGWDLAVARQSGLGGDADLGADAASVFPMDLDVVEAAEGVAAGIPDAARRGSEPAFAPIRPVADDAGVLTRYLGLLGRDRSWQPSTHGYAGARG